MLRTRKRRGSNAIETGLLMPALVLLMFGLVEFSWYMMQEMSVARAVQSGAREGSTTPNAASALSVTRRTIDTQLLAGGLDPGRATVNVSIDPVIGGDLLRVETIVPYYGITGMIPTALNLRASASAMYEGDL